VARPWLLWLWHSRRPSHARLCLARPRKYYYGFLPMKFRRQGVFWLCLGLNERRVGVSRLATGRIVGRISSDKVSTHRPTQWTSAFPTTPDPEGWMFEGVFDGDTPTHVETCSQADLNRPFYWQSGMTFPAGPPGVTPAEGHGSIQFLAGPGCFRSSVPSGFWRVDLVSPNLESRPEWQGISGFSARAFA
jgi:hypothetical protein